MGCTAESTSGPYAQFNSNRFRLSLAAGQLAPKAPAPVPDELRLPFAKGRKLIGGQLAGRKRSAR